MTSRIFLLSAGVFLAGAVRAQSLDLGNTVFIGDSITQGEYGYQSYRYAVWKYLVDDNVTFNFVGTQTGEYASVTPTGTLATAQPTTYQGQTFSNVSEGHFGWRASWESGSVATPAGKYNTNNLGNGDLRNWLGLSNTYQVNSDSTGNTTTGVSTATYTGTTYTPNTAFIMLGTNDIASSGGPNLTGAQTYANIAAMVVQLQQSNAAVRVYLLSVPPSANFTTAQSQQVAILNADLASGAAGLSAGASTVSYIAITPGFTPATSGADSTQVDGTHPNLTGMSEIANNIAIGMGLDPRTVGLSRLTGSAFATQQVTSLPGTTAGSTLYRTGSGWSAGTGGVMNLNSTSGASTLQSAWNLATGASYSVEVSLQMLAGATTNNFVIWSNSNTTAAGFLRVYANQTAWGYTGANGYTQLLDFNDNTAGLNTFRIVFNGSTYDVWRDGALIGENLAGSSASGTTNALTLGNYTSSETTVATVASVAIDTTGAYAPTTFAAVPEPSAYGLIGAGTLATLAFVRRRRRKTA